MLKNILYSFLICVSTTAIAHPGIGIVLDTKGNLYHTDLFHIYKLTPDGQQTIAVRNVHSHELYIDAADNLYGEHLWYEGEAIDKWGYYLWKLDATGKLVRVRDATEGFRTDYSYVRDATGNMYWVERGDTCTFIRRDTNGQNHVIASGVFRDVRWMYCTPDGIVYFTDLDELHRILPDGRMEIVARDLSEHGSSFSLASDRHNIFGIWTDDEQNIYLAIYGGRCVKKISLDGSISIVAVSDGNWSPTGGVFDHEGNLWLLEYSTTNAARVRKVEMAGISPGSLKFKNYLNIVTPLVIAILLLILIICLIRRIRSRKKIQSTTAGAINRG